MVGISGFIFGGHQAWVHLSSQDSPATRAPASIIGLSAAQSADISALLRKTKCLVNINRMLSLSSIVDPMVGNDYVGFIIFIKCLALCSMIASNFLMRDIYLRLRRVTASTTGATSWRQKVSLTQTILFLLSLGDFFRWALFFCFFFMWQRYH